MLVKMRKRIKQIKRKAVKKVAPIYKYLTLKWIYPREYRKYSKQPIDEKKVIFIELRYQRIENHFEVLYDKLTKEYDFDVRTHFMQMGQLRKARMFKREMALIRDLATAKYIFIADGYYLMGALDLRKETQYTQLWHGCGAFKKFGYSTVDLIFGGNKKEQDKYPTHGNYTMVTVSSPEVVWAYEEAMRSPEGIVKPTGISRTDVFYDRSFIGKAYDKLQALIPESKAKKVILYAPTFRGRVARATTPDELDIAQFMEKLGEEYILLIKHHPLIKHRPEIAEAYQQFAYDVTKEMEIEELICTADICITDYSSLIYEYSIFEKPMLFFAYDLADFCDWRGFYYPYDELTPGPVLTKNEELISYIKQVEDKFDKEQVRTFRDKFMSACDGGATERIMKMVFAEALDQYRKRNQNTRTNSVEKLKNNCPT